MQHRSSLCCFTQEKARSHWREVGRWRDRHSCLCGLCCTVRFPLQYRARVLHNQLFSSLDSFSPILALLGSLSLHHRQSGLQVPPFAFGSGTPLDCTSVHTILSPLLCYLLCLSTSRVPFMNERYKCSNLTMTDNSLEGHMEGREAGCFNMCLAIMRRRCGKPAGAKEAVYRILKILLGRSLFSSRTRT